MKNRLIILVIIFLTACNLDAPLSPSEELQSLSVLDLIIEHDDYIDLINNRSINKEVPCKIKYEGEEYQGEIRASGAGSRYYFKWSYRVKLEEGYRIDGINEFNLSAQVEDPSMLHTTLTSKLYSAAGFIPFKAKHTFLRINNDDKGLYSFIEVIKEDFFDKNNLPVYELYKLGFSSSLSFDPPSYPQFTYSKQIPDDEHFYNLTQLIHAIDMSDTSNLRSTLDSHIDLHQYMRYHAITSISANVDAFTNNFYLYKRTSDAPFEVIPWDYDKSFWSQTEAAIVGDNALIRKIFQNNSLFNEYKIIMQEQLNELFTENVLFPVIDSTAAVIGDAYNLDNYLGRKRYNFRDELEHLKEFIIYRRNLVQDKLNHLTQNYFER